MNAGLNSYKKTFFSQWGEDGILEEIFKRIGTKHCYCVEFGAGNGYECSNVWHLIKDLGWSALLMDADPARYQKWDSLLKTYPKARILNLRIAIEGDSSVDHVLEYNNVPKDLDLLSIDIDGNDYHVLKSINAYRPRVLIVEFNATIPPQDSIIQEPGEPVNFGCSACALVDLAHTKGYLLAATTRANCIFVEKSEFPKLKISEPTLQEIFDTSALSYIISAYDGSLYLKNEYPEQQPIYGHLMNSKNLRIRPDSNFTLTFGPTADRSFSKTLTRRYQPIKAFRSNTSETFIPFIIRTIKVLFWKKA